MLTLADATMIKDVYPGLSDIKTNQCLPYINMMTMNSGEIALVEVADSGDVDTVKGVFQDRIDAQVAAAHIIPAPSRPGRTIPGGLQQQLCDDGGPRGLRRHRERIQRAVLSSRPFTQGWPPLAPHSLDPELPRGPRFHCRELGGTRQL